jgi:hypothetical protein
MCYDTKNIYPWLDHFSLFLELVDHYNDACVWFGGKNLFPKLNM